MPRGPSPSPAPPIRVLAIDPALRNTGYAVLEKVGTKIVALEFGTIKNRADLLQTGCLVAIHEKVRDLIARHRVEGLAIVQK